MDETRGRSCAFISPRQTILEIRKAGGIHENEGKGKYRAGNYRKGKHRAGKYGQVYTERKGANGAPPGENPEKYARCGRAGRMPSPPAQGCRQSGLS